MKKLAIIAVLALSSICASAQYTTPRYGTAPNQDNTGRTLNWGKITKADTAGSTVDTVTTSFVGSNGQSYYHTDMVFNLADSCVFAISSVGGCHFGDQLTIIINAAAVSGAFVNFLGYSALATKWDMTSTGTKISVASGKRATLNFIFDGTVWVQEDRSTH